MEKWIEVKKKLPESGQEVLTYFYDEPFDVDQFQILTYCKKGESLITDTDGSLINDLLGVNNTIITEDGFYICDDDKWRKHADVITHWKPLIGPMPITFN